MAMQLKTILNRVEKLKSFVYENAEWGQHRGRDALLVKIRPRRGARAVCSGCGQRRRGYDRLQERRFEYVPLWGLAVVLLYAMRRVDCSRCGVTVEMVPWASGKQQLANSYVWFLARWAKRLSWAEVASVFGTSWDTVYRAVSEAVAWGRAHMNLEGVKSIGVDEIAWKKGHSYLTLVYQIDRGFRRLLWVGDKRTVKTFLGFFRWFGPERSQRLEFVCSDMWQAYIKVIAKKAGQAVHVLDRFHIVAKMNKAIDEVRAGEAKELARKGYVPILKKSRWCLLKRPENLTERQETKLSELVQFNLKSVRAYLLKEDFQGFWEYVSPAWAGKFLDRWTTRAMRSRIEPMKKIARMLRSHRELILNWFRARGELSSAVVEGLNNKAKLTTKKAYGYKSFKVASVALYHTLGNLPEPKRTHRFC